MRSTKMGALAVLALCATVGFGRPAMADPGQGAPDQNQSQGTQDQSQSAPDQSAQNQGQDQSAQDHGQSQKQNEQDRRWEQRFEKLSKALNLTDEQQEKIKPLFQNQEEQIEAVRGDKTLSRREQRTKIKEIRAATRDQVKSLLTPEQVEKWNQFKEEAGERREQTSDRDGDGRTWRTHRRDRQPMTWQERFEQFSQTLNLTQDQKEKIQPLFQDADQQITAVYDDTTVAKADKPAKVQAIRSATEEKIEPFLTPDQMEKWGQWKQQGWEGAPESQSVTQTQTVWQMHLRQGTWKQQFNRLNKAVNLTAEQQENIKPLFQEAGRQVQALKRDKSMSKQDKQAATEDLWKTTWTQVQTYLTPEQLEKLGIQPAPAPAPTTGTADQTPPSSSDPTPPSADPTPPSADPTPAPNNGDDGK